MDLAYLATNRRYVRAPWLDYLESKLLDLEARKITRLIVEVPPRHGKSTLISRTFPAWWLGRHANDQVILASYAADFAAGWGEKAKTAMIELGPDVFGRTVSQTKAARSDWQVAGFEGGMVTAGVGGPITGRGGNLFIIDDPVKNAEEAHSEVYREKTWEWFLSTAYTRLEPDGVMVVIMTRWHEDDLVGRILSGRGAVEADIDEHWEVVRFPALCEDPDDPLEQELGRAEGDALFPERYPVKKLESIRREVGPYWFAALYQQRPSPLEGAFFLDEWFREFHADWASGIYALPQRDGTVKRYRRDECPVFETVDPAFTKTQTSDWTVISTWALTPGGDLLWLDMKRKKMEGPDIVPEMRRSYNQWRPGRQWVESGGAQATIYQMAQRAGLPVSELQAEGIKEVRALPAQAKAADGKLWFRAGAPWVGDAKAEMLVFPNGKHDDIVDTAAYAAIVMAKHGPGGVGSIRRVLR